MLPSSLLAAVVVVGLAGRVAADFTCRTESTGNYLVDASTCRADEIYEAFRPAAVESLQCVGDKISGLQGNGNSAGVYCRSAANTINNAGVAAFLTDWRTLVCVS
jgi:hypothetical protein